MIRLLLVRLPESLCELPPVSLARDLVDYLGLLFALALVVVGILGTRYALRTLKAIEKQTEHTVNSERPWLFLRVYTQGFVQSYLASSRIKELYWRISNEGRTVANVIEAGVRCVKYTGMEKTQVLTVPPDYGTIIPLYNVPLAPGGLIPLWSNVEIAGKESKGLNVDDIAAIREKGDDLVAFGFVKYKDQFGGVRESRFCYSFIPQLQDFRIALGAPAEYHNAPSAELVQARPVRRFRFGLNSTGLVFGLLGAILLFYSISLKRTNYRLVETANHQVAICFSDKLVVAGYGGPLVVSNDPCPNALEPSVAPAIQYEHPTFVKVGLGLLIIGFLCQAFSEIIPQTS